ncbi:MAG: RNA polymerase sigma factor (sigma-70 family) [Arcticibacterium sp.]|jgi:RNA polymerase sigma factor (sigma-70 family)
MSDEEALIEAVLEGNQEAYGRFVKQYERLVFYVVQKLVDREEDVEDLAQDIFMKVFKHLKNFKRESKLSTWISQIAYRESLNYLKKQKRFTESKVEEHEFLQLADTAKTPEELSTSSDIGVLVKHAVSLLPEHYRQVLVLYHMEEFSYPEIGEITGMPEGTVKNYIFRARKLLKEQLDPLMKSKQL